MRGLGNDLVEIARIKGAHEQHGDGFLKRLFTQREQSYCFACQDPYPRLAGRFAAKEAIAKALGLGFGTELSWLDLEILPNEQGKPIVHLSKALEQRLGSCAILLSISHCKTLASAVAIWD